MYKYWLALDGGKSTHCPCRLVHHGKFWQEVDLHPSRFLCHLIWCKDCLWAVASFRYHLWYRYQTSLTNPFHERVRCKLALRACLNWQTKKKKCSKSIFMLTKAEPLNNPTFCRARWTTMALLVGLQVKIILHKKCAKFAFLVPLRI